jgi:chemotaxis protein methyltransferase CheR
MSQEFNIIRNFLCKNSGHNLEDDKLYLVQARLLPLVKELGLKDLNHLAHKISQGNDNQLSKKIIEAMTVHETYFFRDKVPFENIEKYVIPRILEQKKSFKKFKIWCAACSTGQEPYSLAIVLDQYAKNFNGWNIEILATDISEQAIDFARNGQYSHFEVQRGMPINHLMRYFVQHKDYWQINDYIKSKVKFRQLNLLHDFTNIGTQDLILCRNVMIYFDIETKKKIIAKFIKIMERDGCIMIGSSESMIGLTDKLRLYAPSNHLYTLS